MALGDYILCCKCEVKLIYDGDRGQREWWEERFGKPPKIECPDCKTQRTWVGLTDEEIWKFWWSRPEVPESEDDSMEAEFVAAVRRVLAAHGIKEKNT